MTGLFVDGVKEEYLDDAQERYSKLRESSHQYVINQFGLSCFTQDKSSREGGWVAKTFNLYVFPEPISRDAQSRKFLCDSGSLSFLASNGFDFSKWITKGIPFMPAKEKEDRIKAALSTYSERKSSKEPIVPNDKAYQDFAALFATQLQTFLSGTDTSFLTDEMNSFKRLLAYQEIERLKLGATLFIKRIDTSNGYGKLQLTRGSEDEVRALQEADVAQQVEKINSSAAFTRVLEAMRASGKPAVGHNCNFDVAYLLAIVEKSLPRQWEDYKLLVKDWFPGGIYDTKHIARQVPEVFKGWTGLGDCFKYLTEEGNEGYERAKLLLAQAGEADLPKLHHATGFTKYENIEAGSLAHEAGYDAFMTAAVFARLAPLVQAKASASTAISQVSFDQELDPLSPLRSYMGRLNTMKTDMPYTNLYGPDPLLARPNLFFISAVPPSSDPLSIVASNEDLRATDVHKLFENVGLSQPKPKLTPWSPQSSFAGNGQGQGQEKVSMSPLGWFVEVDPSLTPLVLPKIMGGAGTTITLSSSGATIRIRVVPWERFVTEKQTIAAAEKQPVRPAKRQRVEQETITIAPPRDEAHTQTPRAAAEERKGCVVM